MGYSKLNIDEIDDAAPGFGITSQEARNVRKQIGADRVGLAHYRVKAGQRIEFGHRHKTMEEVYVVLSGDGAFKVDDEVFEVSALDVVYVAPESWRAWEGGQEGMDVLAFGEHTEGPDESEMEMGWWK